MTKEKLSHLIRIAVIALLLIGAVILCWQSGYFSGLGDRLRSDPEGDAQTGGALPQLSAAEKADFVRPDVLLVRLQNGTEAVEYSGEAMQTVLRQFLPSLGEVLGTAGNPEHITEQTFRAGLAGECVFLRFPCRFPLRLLSDWLGSEMNGASADLNSSMLYLDLSEERAQLCFEDSSGQFFRCSTAAISENLRARVTDAEGVEAVFAFEDESLHALAPYSVILRKMPAIRAAESAPVRDGLDAAELLRAVGMNSFVSSSYAEADGTRVFVQDQMTLRIGADGVVSFRTEGQPARVQSGQSLVGMVNRACAIAAAIAQDRCGDAELRFVGAEYSVSEQQYTVRFAYCVNGVPVELSGGDAAKIVLQGGSPVELRFDLRRYTLAEDTVSLLPMVQAAAILNAGEGGELELRYIDGSDGVQCMWVKG